MKEKEINTPDNYNDDIDIIDDCNIDYDGCGDSGGDDETFYG